MSSSIGKPILCKAAIAKEAGKPLVIEEVEVAAPKAHEIRIKIICTSLCHSDLTLWSLKEPPGYFPRILGHEAVGIVESIGENVDDFDEGDFVMPVFLANCGDCKDCKSKKSNLCSTFPFKLSHLMPRDDTSRFTGSNGEMLYHCLHVSSFTEYTVVDIAHVTKVDPQIQPNRACLLSCGVSTAWKTAQVDEGSTVAVFGLGAIGLAVINEMTDGGADYCFECVGMASKIVCHKQKSDGFTFNATGLGKDSGVRSR
ncbi:Alcohol dehydrogenase-like 7 [Bienertia sinuspersici]